MIATTHNLQQQKVHLWLTLAGLTGIVSLFLPFTLSVSPMQALQEKDFWKLAAPFFLSVLISLAVLRWLITSSFSRSWQAIGYIISAGSAFITISFFFTGSISPSEFMEWIAFAAAVVVILASSWLVIAKLRKQLAGGYCPLIALQVAYLANCLMCLVLFRPENSSMFGFSWQIGAWFSLATAVIYLLQIYLFTRQSNEPSE
jgi:uncharacterized membrane protein (DUF373 family)